MRRMGAVGVLVVALAAPLGAAAQKAVIVVRHAENSGDALTEVGRAQAERLARALAGAEVAAVYSTDSQRTRATATPLAQARGLEIRPYDTAAGPGAFDARPFVARLREEHPRDVVVVVGHVTTIPDLLRALGCPDEVTIAPRDYDQLFVVVPTGTARGTLVVVRY